MRPSFDQQYKLIILGDSGVGKTCLLMRFTEDKFTQSHITTIGIDFKTKNLNIGGKTIKLQIWDTAGQEKFRTITQTYYKGAMGIILAFDCSDQKSFDSIKSWMKQIEAHASPGVAKILIGNKSDLPERVVSTEKGQKLADDYKIKYFETSAKTGVNVIEAFDYIANEISKSGIATKTAGTNEGVSRINPNPTIDKKEEEKTNEQVYRTIKCPLKSVLKEFSA